MGYNDAILNETDRQKVKALQAQWQAANAAGDTAGMDTAHAGAESIRARYGYSGGTAGDEYHQTGENTQLYAGQNQSNSINSVYDAQLEKQKQALESAYNQKELEYAAAAERLPAEYDAARNTLSAQNEIEKANFNEQAAASGLNVGAGSQARLSQSNAYQSGMTAIGRAQAEAASSLQLERSKAKAAYQDAIQQAIRENDAARAQALYEEAQRIDDNLVSNALNQASLDTTRSNTEYARQLETAQTLAQYGDFSGYLALGYTQEQTDSMRRLWEAQNADLLARMNGTSDTGVPGVGSDPEEPTPTKDIDYNDPQTLQDALMTTNTIRAMIRRGDSYGTVYKAVHDAKDGGLIDARTAASLLQTAGRN